MLKLKYKKTFLIFQSRTKTMPYVHSKLVVRSATSIYCCQGWARNGAATDCQQGILLLI